MFMAIIRWFRSLFKKKTPPQQEITLSWGVDTLNTDGGTQCLPKDGSGGNASSTDWSVGQQQVGVPGVLYKASKFVVDADDAPGYLSIILQRYLGGNPVSGWMPNVVLTSGSTRIEQDLGGALVEGEATMQAQVGFSPVVNGAPIHNVKVKMILIKA